MRHLTLVSELDAQPHGTRYKPRLIAVGFRHWRAAEQLPPTCPQGFVYVPQSTAPDAFEEAQGRWGQWFPAAHVICGPKSRN